MSAFPSLLDAVHYLQRELAKAASRGAEPNQLVGLIDPRNPARVVAKLVTRADARRVYAEIATGYPLNTATEIVRCIDEADAPDTLRVVAFDSEVVISLSLVDFVRRTEIAYRGALNGLADATFKRPTAAN